MRCFGITKSFSRCKNNCKVLFCSKHRLQWWAIVAIIATLGGLFQDVIFPIFSDDPNEELKELITSKKTKFESSGEELAKIIKERQFRLNVKIDSLDNSLENATINLSELYNVKRRVLEFKKKLSLARNELNSLIEKEIEALKKGDLILSHEIKSQINHVPYKFNLDEFKKDTLIQTSKELIKLILDMEEVISMACISSPTWCYESGRVRDSLVIKYFTLNEILKLSGHQIDTIEISYVIEDYFEEDRKRFGYE